MVVDAESSYSIPKCSLGVWVWMTPENDDDKNDDQRRNAAANQRRNGGDAASSLVDGEGSRRCLEVAILSLTAVGVSALAKTSMVLPRYLQWSLAANLGLAIIGYVVTSKTIAAMGPTFIGARLRGIDLNKRTTHRDNNGNLVRPIVGVELPESMGTVSATVFILVMSVFVPFACAVYKMDERNFPHADSAEYLAAVLTITFATFMGFADDVLDLQWRHKIPLPFLATMPLLLVYYANGDQTGVMIPNQLRGLFGDYVDLGIFWYIFLLILAVFSTHAINIYAGVNGLEVGQSVVIGASVLILNIAQLARTPLHLREHREQHLQSLFIIIPFLAVSLALLRLNWFPSKVFVGDTYCYFAGMTFAAVCIVGHFSKTMVLFMLPQWINFLYSCPQLFPFIGIPIPRHRMPTFDSERGFVKNSYTEFKPEELKPLGKAVFDVIKKLKLAHVQPPSDGGVVRMSNLTLINFVLFVFGPCREDVLCLRLLGLQSLCSLITFSGRFYMAGYLFDQSY